MQKMAQIKSFVVTKKWYIIPFVALILIGGAIYFSRSKEVRGAADVRPEVKVGRVIDLMGGSTLSAVAHIRSMSEAKISADSGGRVTRIAASLGDRVSAGQVLAEMENASQRAVVLQAQGALEAVKAVNTNTDVLLDSAKNAALSALLSAYATAQSAVHDTIDDTFTNPESGSRKYTVLTTRSQDKMLLENTRGDLSVILKRESAMSGSLTVNSELGIELTRAETDLRAIRTFLDTDIMVLSAGIPSPEISQSMITGYVTDATAARTAITASISSMVSTKNGLQVASNNSGGAGTISSSGAALKQAQGLYDASLASLEKTIIRSPIRGTLNNFTIKLGDYLTASQEVAIVSNNGTLEAVTSVIEGDRFRISVGQTVTFDGGTTGTITKIAPALDPVSRRIEVRISLSAAAAKVLTNGSSVHVAFAAASPMTGAPLSVPITALRMEADRTIVFLVIDGKLTAQEIKVGTISGDFVQVSEGLAADTEIVADARGLKEGEEVVVK